MKLKLIFAAACAVLTGAASAAAFPETYNGHIGLSVTKDVCRIMSDDGAFETQCKVFQEAGLLRATGEDYVFSDMAITLGSEAWSLFKNVFRIANISQTPREENHTFILKQDGKVLEEKTVSSTEEHPISINHINFYSVPTPCTQPKDPIRQIRSVYNFIITPGSYDKVAKTWRYVVAETNTGPTNLESMESLGCAWQPDFAVVSTLYTTDAQPAGTAFSIKLAGSLELNIKTEITK